MKRYLRIAAVFALAASAISAGTSNAQTSTEDTTPTMSFQDFKPRYQYRKDRWHAVKVRLCRSHAAPHRWPSANEVAPAWRDNRLNRLHRRIAYAASRGSACLPTSPEAIIRYVFPAVTESAAVSVASCESHLSPSAYNPSGAAGLFQLMPIWYAGKFDPFNALANTRAAYGLSSGGYNWTPWVCQP